MFKILIVDDDRNKIKLLIEYAKKYFLDNNITDFLIETAKSYDSAIKKILSNKYIAIVLDDDFPDADGEHIVNGQFVALLNAAYSHNIYVPVLLVSGNMKYIEKIYGVESTNIQNTLNTFLKKIVVQGR
jgi:CheY-like chemotaxis protein